MSPRRAWPRGGVRTRLPAVWKRQAAQFSPTDISGLALWLDGSDGSTLFQNSDGTVPAVNSGDPVGYWADKSGNGRHATQATGANRPTVGSHNSRKALAFDGANAWMRTERTTYAARSVITVFRRTGSANGFYLSPFAKQSSVAAGYGGSAYQVAYGNEGGWSTSSAGVGKMYYASNATPHKLSAAFMRGAAMTLADAQAFSTGISAAPNTNDAELLYAEAATDTDGNQAWFIGTEPFATTRKYPANILELLIYNRALTTAERQRLERYLAARWGITLAPQVSNADAQDWINRVYANGGTVTPSTASAVNQFCNDIDSAVIRSKFYRLNLFCGTGLNACLVPLYRGIAAGTGGNFLTRSTTRDGGSFSSAVWETIGSSPVPTKNGDVASPNGSPTATSVTYGATSGYSALRWSSNYAGGWTANATGTFSVWARKPVTGGAASIRLTTNNAAGWNTGVSQKFALTTEWQRLSVTGNLSTGVDMFALIGTGDASGGIDTDCIGTVELWRPQVEVGSTATAWQACQYGNTTDTNVGPFVSDDYAETGASGGLKGNGSSKYLDTGFPMNTLPSTTSGHAAVYCPNRSSRVSFAGMIGVNTLGSSGFGISTDTSVYGIWGQLAFATNTTNGFLLSSRTSGSSQTTYVNASSIATNNTPTTPTASSLNAPVFANRSSAGSVDNYDSRRYCGYSIGTGMDAGQAASYYAAMQAFQAALGRAT